MRQVLVSFELSVTQSTDGVFIASKPDYLFQDAFDKDDDESFSKLCDLEYKFCSLVDAFKALGVRVIARRKEVTSLDGQL